MQKVYIKVIGMTCNSCKNKITNTLNKIEWIHNVEVILENNIVILELDELTYDIEEVINLICDLGYDTNLEKVFETEEEFKISRKQNIFNIGITFLYIILIYILVKRLFGFDFLNNIPTIETNIALPILFVIGLMTSIHCVGMCGAINLAASMGIKQKQSFKRPILYNLGRVISYTDTGGIAGLLGRVLTPSLFMQGMLVGLASVFMLLMGLSMLGIISKKILNIIPKSSKLNKIKTSSPLALGLLNGLMPCGPLQAMQVYAISTASFILGATSMFLFALGTVPLMLLFGLLFNSLKGRKILIMQRISATLVILLSFFMFTRATGYLGISIFNNSSTYEIAEIKEDGYQYVNVDVKNNSYEKIYVQKNVPLKLNLKVSKGNLNGCNNPIMIPSMNIKKKLNEGNNIIEFTPTESIGYSCWMSMIRSQIIVVDDIKNFNIKEDKSI